MALHSQNLQVVSKTTLTKFPVCNGSGEKVPTNRMLGVYFPSLDHPLKCIWLL